MMMLECFVSIWPRGKFLLFFVCCVFIEVLSNMKYVAVVGPSVWTHKKEEWNLLLGLCWTIFISLPSFFSLSRPFSTFIPQRNEWKREKHEGIPLFLLPYSHKEQKTWWTIIIMKQWVSNGMQREQVPKEELSELFTSRYSNPNFNSPLLLFCLFQFPQIHHNPLCKFCFTKCWEDPSFCE